MVATGVRLQEAVGGGHQVLHLRQRAAGRFQCGQAFQVLPGGATISPTDRPQATCHIPVPPHAAVVSPPAATALLHRRIHIRHQAHTRPGKRILSFKMFGWVFCLFRFNRNSLFRYRSETTETNCFETNRKKRKKRKKTKKPKKTKKTNKSEKNRKKS